MQICQRNGWSIQRDWDQLTDWERTEWLAWQERQEMKRDAVLKSLKGKDGTISAYAASAYAMLMMES